MNWIQLINDILDSGMTQAQLGAEIGRNQAWVSEFVRGKIKTVRWEDGQKLIRLRAERCPMRASV